MTISNDGSKEGFISIFGQAVNGRRITGQNPARMARRLTRSERPSSLGPKLAYPQNAEDAQLHIMSTAPTLWPTRPFVGTDPASHENGRFSGLRLKKSMMTMLLLLMVTMVYDDDGYIDTQVGRTRT